MSDLISRQDAIDIVDEIIARDTSGNNDVVKAMEAWKVSIKFLPSAQQEKVCIATITLSEEQLHEVGEKAKNEIVQMLPSAQQWIPCSERLPKEDGFYLVSVGSPYKTVRVYEYKPCEGWENENLWKADGTYCFNWFVEAWMPLPQPFGEMDGEKNEFYNRNA